MKKKSKIPLTLWAFALALILSAQARSGDAEMQTAVDTMTKVHGATQRELSKPDCDHASDQTPSQMQCMESQVPPEQTFCPRDLNNTQPQSRVVNPALFPVRLMCSVQNMNARQREAVKRVVVTNPPPLPVLKKLGELQRFAPESDPALALVIAERESGALGFKKGDKIVDTFKSGGMDFLGDILPHMRASIPPTYRDQWKSAEQPRTNVAGNSGRPGLIPQKDLILAYGSFIHHRYLNFRRAAIKLGIKKETLNTLSPEAIKAWQAIFFASDAGLECIPMGARKCKLPHGGFGGMTALTYLVKNGHSLENILTNSELAKYARARMAVDAAHRAIAVEKIIGIHCS